MRQWVVLLLAVFSLLPNAFGLTQVFVSETQVTLTQTSAGHYCIPSATISALDGYATDYYNAHGGIIVNGLEKYGNVSMSATPNFYSNFMNYSPPTSYGYGEGSGPSASGMSCENSFIFDMAGNNFFSQSPYLGSAIEICSAVLDHFEPDATRHYWCVYGVVDMGSHFLEFPLDDYAENYTPYTATISTIFDHHTSGGFYSPNKDGVIRAYDGEEVGNTYPVCGDGSNPPCTSSFTGYRKDASGTAFSLDLLTGYDDDDTSDNPDSPKNILWYDGHPGYDYPVPHYTEIKAAHGGILCVASLRTSSGGGQMWTADNTHCPYPQDTIADSGSTDSWDHFHTFYIVYDDNTAYSTWYLLSDDLSGTETSGVKGDILSQGYAEVTKGQVVATVGTWGITPTAYHLHLEVRLKGNTPVDPYGNGNSNILWEDQP